MKQRKVMGKQRTKVNVIERKISRKSERLEYKINGRGETWRNYK